MLAWQPFVLNVSPDGKVKKLAYLAGCWLDLAQIWYGGTFDSESKTNNKILLLRQNDLNVKCLCITYGKCL